MAYLTRRSRGDEPHPKGSYISFLGTLSEDPFAVLDRLGQQPIFWVDDPNDVDGYWVATRFEDVRDIMQDAEAFSSIQTHIPLIPLGEPLLPSETDPPYTQKLRAVLMPHLTAKKSATLEPRMRAVCTEIIESFRADGRCDVVEQFSRVYPITIFIELFGLPAERKEEFRRQANLFLHDADRRAFAWSNIRAIVEGEIVAKRANPRDDLLSAIANGRIDGELLDLRVAVGLASTVFLGGLDTLPSSISWSLRFLANNPEYRRQILERPAIIPGAVEELLRLYSVSSPLRRVARDMDFRGANMLTGDRVLCSVPSADRDVATFGPKADFERDNNPHLTFATGPHRCLGSHIARHEFAVALEIWHELIPEYRIADQAKIEFSGPVFAIENLPLEWNV
jgi:cytochrome P450